MIDFDDYTNENRTEHNKNWPHTPDKPYRILIIGDSRLGKTNVLLNLIEDQPHIDEVYLYAKDSHEAKYQYLINKRESVGINHFKDPKTFLEYSNDMRDIYKNMNYYNPYKENEILIVFDDIIADMINNKKLNSIVTELCIRGRKCNISLVFITHSNFKVPKNVILYYSLFYRENPKKENFNELVQIVHQIFEKKISLIFIENAPVNHIIF